MNKKEGGNTIPSANITKRVIADTMIKMMGECPLSKISVGKIVKKCGLNRNSFYYHFKDKYDLVNWIFYTNYSAKINKDETVSYWEHFERICRFFYDDRKFYINAFSETGQNSFAEYFSGIISATILTKFEDVLCDEGFKDFYTSFSADAFTFLISRWLSQGAKVPPERLVEYARKALATLVARLIPDER